MTNLGAASDLDVFQNGDLVAEVFLASDGEVRYEMTAEAGSEGRWRMRAEGRGQPECAAEATFTVTGLPGTATAPVVPERPQPGDGSAPMALAAGIVGLVAALRRFRGSADRSAA